MRPWPRREPAGLHPERLPGHAVFPAPLGEDTDGQGIFGEWAWWTGRSLRLTMERELDEVIDSEVLRAEALATGSEILRRFLNAYRWRLGRPAVHPIPVDPRALTLELLHDDGRKEALTEPVSAFFYQNMPSKPPLESSVNATTLPTLQADVQEERPHPSPASSAWMPRRWRCRANRSAPSWYANLSKGENVRSPDGGAGRWPA